MPDPLIGIRDRALAALLEVADDPTADGIARVVAADMALVEAKRQAKQERKARKKGK
jgi:hypothetical protein